MYLEYFALDRHPFRITPDPSLFCPCGGRGEILEALWYAITSGEGIVKVVGEVGSGKTMLCRILEERLPKSIEIVYLANPRLTPHEILYAIAFELKLPVTVETERLLVLQQLQAYLLQQHGANRSVVAFIEEAQGMPEETLEEIRLLSNLETHRHKLLQMVLFGQPELDKVLKKQNLRQLRERITHSFHLEPLTPAEVSEYLRSRLQAAGCSRSKVFSTGAEKRIAQASQGMIRRINILADKAMLAAYASTSGLGASSTQAMVQARHVRAAIRDCEFRIPFHHRIRSRGTVLVLAVVALFAVAGWRAVGMDKFQRIVRPAPPAHQVSADRTPGEAAPAPAALPEKDAATGPQSSPVPAPIPARDNLGAGSTDVAPPAPPAEPVTPAGNKLMEIRRAATLRWMKKVNPDDYTIQLLAVDSQESKYVEKFIEQVSSGSVLDKIYLCPGRKGGRDIWIVIFSEFRGATPARRAIDELPRELRRFQPFIRRLGDVLNSAPTPQGTRS